MDNTIKQYLKGIINMIYPELCIACNNQDREANEAFCIDCYSELPFTNQCMLKNNTFKEHFKGKIKIEHGAALFFFVKKGIIQRLIQELKYKNNPKIGVMLGSMLGLEIAKSPYFGKIDLVVPVPLHPQKKAKRGYNQSEKIVTGIVKTLGAKICTNNLVRVKNTTTQTQMNREQRISNLENAFMINDKSKFENKNILLVDDVLTTGSTLLESSKILRNIDGLKLNFATLAMGEYV